MLLNEFAESTFSIISPVDMERLSSPFAIYSLVIENNVVVDLCVEAFNPAFKRLVNCEVAIGQCMSSFASRRAWDFWIGKADEAYRKGRVYFEVHHYTSVCTKVHFPIVIASPVECLGKRAIGVLFIQDIRFMQTKYCALCKDGSLDKVRVDLEVDEDLGISNCEFCMALQGFLENKKL